MPRLTSIVVWLCKKFNRNQLEFIIARLHDILDKKILEVQPRDDFKEQHPNYRNFYVDPEPPLDASSKPSKKKKKNWKKIQKRHRKKKVKA